MFIVYLHTKCQALIFTAIRSKAKEEFHTGTILSFYIQHLLRNILTVVWRVGEEMTDRPSRQFFGSYTSSMWNCRCSVYASNCTWRKLRVPNQYGIKTGLGTQNHIGLLTVIEAVAWTGRCVGLSKNRGWVPCRGRYFLFSATSVLLWGQAGCLVGTGGHWWGVAVGAWRWLNLWIQGALPLLPHGSPWREA